MDTATVGTAAVTGVTVGEATAGNAAAACRSTVAVFTVASFTVASFTIASITVALSTAASQQRVLDSGALTISQGGIVIGREEFTVRAGRASGGRDGFTIASSVFYPPDRAEATLAPVVEVGPDSVPITLQLDVFDGAQRRVYAQLGARRVTVRSVSPQGESVREYPGGGRFVIVDDSSFALNAIPPGRAPGSVSVLWPRHGRREAGELADLGMARTEVGVRSAELQHFQLTTGADTRDLWYDERGRLMKVDVPAAGLSAVRAPGPGR
ncbi:MAG: hypothetical protein HY560_02940 [Gemmatimonadetes bacterium]|nr:hypothetical protein [Gemmatimonadota bacterium]